MTVEWLILADAAEVVGGKLYLMGGGWEALTIQTGFPARHPLAVAAAVSASWQETHQVHRISIDIDDQDGGNLAKVEGHLEVGRSPGIPAGATQRIQLAARFELELPKPGTYVVVAKIEGQEAFRTSFNVLAPVMPHPGHPAVGG